MQRFRTGLLISLPTRNFFGNANVLLPSLIKHIPDPFFQNVYCWSEYKYVIDSRNGTFDSMMASSDLLLHSSDDGISPIGTCWKEYFPDGSSFWLPQLSQ